MSSLIKYLFLLSLLLAQTINACAVSFLQDAEIEGVLQDIVRPILKVAGLNSRDTKIHIIASDDINAFVIDGKNIFISSGLLMFDDTPEAIIGVIAHECGHIAKGHVSSRQDAIRTLQQKATLLFLASIAASVATSSEIGIGTMAMGQDALQNQYLSYSRMQEAAADKAAVDYMHSLNVPMNGLLKLLKGFREKDRIFLKDISLYKRTHPLSVQRIEFLQQHNVGIDSGHSYLKPQLQQRFKAAVAKIRAFILPPAQTLKSMQGRDDEIANYAKAIAYYKNLQLAKAVQLLDQLIAAHPDNPFYYETKGQFLLENGQAKIAIALYEKAVALKPRAELLQLALANAYVMDTAGGDASWRKAVQLLEKLAVDEPRNPFLFHQLGIAYGKLGDVQNSYLALAIEQYLYGEKDRAQKFLHTAEEHGKKHSYANQTARQREKDVQNLLAHG